MDVGDGSRAAREARGGADEGAQPGHRVGLACLGSVEERERAGKPRDRCYGRDVLPVRERLYSSRRALRARRKSGFQRRDCPERDVGKDWAERHVLEHRAGSRLAFAFAGNEVSERAQHADGLFHRSSRKQQALCVV